MLASEEGKPQEAWLLRRRAVGVHAGEARAQANAQVALALACLIHLGLVPQARVALAAEAG